MKIIKTISDISIGQIHIFGEEILKVNYEDLTTNNKTIIDDYYNLCDKLYRESKTILEEPINIGEPIYIMNKPCPVNSDLTVKIYETSYNNDKYNKKIVINIRAIHYNSLGIRDTEWDCDSMVIADMSEERMVDVTPEGYVGVLNSNGDVRLEQIGYVLIEGESFTVIKEYSYAIAESMLQNNMPINQLIHTAIQIADYDGSLNYRLYNV